MFFLKKLHFYVGYKIININYIIGVAIIIVLYFKKKKNNYIKKYTNIFLPKKSIGKFCARDTYKQRLQGSKR